MKKDINEIFLLFFFFRDSFEIFKLMKRYNLFLEFEFLDKEGMIW